MRDEVGGVRKVNDTAAWTTVPAQGKDVLDAVGGKRRHVGVDIRGRAHAGQGAQARSR